ncbi:MAG: N-acetylmuramoyl-L-alanine amidase [Gammaproteobacteria bacterium]|nr:MAG: N-acetylmuramoyl-L-alanine amidase [Gammaproteobacteria bacterium]
MNPPMIHDWPLPYVERLAERRADGIDLVVIHCTELPDMAMAREFGERIQHQESRTGNSGHYYIDRDGSISRFVSELRVAHHTFQFNPRSIGIELVNLGRYPNWNDSRHQMMSEPYPEAQIESLLGLLAQLRETFPDLRWIAGHDALDQRREPASDNPDLMLARRLDPGPMFPWARVLGACALVRWSDSTSP